VKLDIRQYDFFRFSYFATRLDKIHETVKSDRGLAATSESGPFRPLTVAYNPKPYIMNLYPMGAGVLGLSNLMDGWHTFFWNITRNMKCDGYHFAFSSPSVPEPYNNLDVIRAGTETRTVYAMKDSDRWVFYEQGAALDFEETDRYQLRLKRQRLDRDLLISYLEALDLAQNGILEFDDTCLHVEHDW
jgi:hypothetical protein